MIQRPTFKQTAFLLTQNREVLFGGAAGGAKSSGLLLAALQYVDIPNYAAILFRRTYADLAKPGALMDRAYDWLQGTDASWSEQKHLWRFPSGASLSFGHLDIEKDKYDYQSAEFQFIGFDELTHFTETQYRYLFSRLRRLKDSPIPLRVRAASNPGGVGHEWVYRRFFTDHARGRVFISSKLEDNPHLDRVEYERALNELDPVTRKQLRHGDWEVRASGEYFKREWIRTIDAPPAPVRRVRYWDFAATELTKKNKDPDWCVGALVSMSRAGGYVVEDMVRFRKPPAATEAEVTRVARSDGPGVEQHFEQEPGSSSKLFIAHLQGAVLQGHAVYGHTVHKDKTTRAKPFSAACEQGRVTVVRGAWNTAWFDEMESFPTGGHDDVVDASAGGFNQLHISGSTALIKPLTPAVRHGLGALEM